MSQKLEPQASNDLPAGQLQQQAKQQQPQQQQQQRSRSQAEPQVAEVEYLRIQDAAQDELDQPERPAGQLDEAGSPSRSGSWPSADGSAQPPARALSQPGCLMEGGVPGAPAEAGCGGALNMSGRLTLATLACLLSAGFQHGYHGAVLNAPERWIGQFINQTSSAPAQPLSDAEAQLDFKLGLLVAIFCAGGCVGALAAEVLARRCGPKRSLLHNNLLVLLACPMMSLAKPLSSYQLLLLGRLLIGINAGLNAALAPIYLTDIAPCHLRGPLAALYQLALVLAMLASNLLGLPHLLGGPNCWPFLFLVPILPALTSLYSLAKCPESPRFLLLERASELQAQQALAWFRETLDIQDEMESLRLERQRALNRGEPFGWSHLFGTQMNLRRPLIIAAVLMVSQQFSGINAVLFFSTNIFRDAGMSEMVAIWATLGMGLLNLLLTIGSLFLIHRTGRKTLYMNGLIGMAGASFLLACCLAPTPVAGPLASILAVLAVYLYIAMFAIGLGPIPWLLTAEMFPNEAKALASSLSVALNWFANFTVTLCFLPLTNILHGHIFFLFATLLTLIYLFSYYKVPETKGATTEEISSLFKR